MALGSRLGNLALSRDATTHKVAVAPPPQEMAVSRHLSAEACSQVSGYDFLAPTEYV